jgi:hypothetical protein
MVCIEIILDAIKKQFTAKFTLKDKEDSKPIAGFVCSIAGLTGTTDASGIVTVGPFRKGTYDYLCTHPDYENLTGTKTTP